MKYDLASLLNIVMDGWVPLDALEATELAYKKVFNGMLTAVLANKNPDDDKPVKDEVVLRSIWPYDLPDVG